MYINKTMFNNPGWQILKTQKRKGLSPLFGFNITQIRFTLEAK